MSALRGRSFEADVLPRDSGPEKTLSALVVVAPRTAVGPCSAS
ncbi:hypothetical protein TSOC_001017, partial [Tetrabaena socialis]